MNCRKKRFRYFLRSQFTKPACLPHIIFNVGRYNSLSKWKGSPPYICFCLPLKAESVPNRHRIIPSLWPGGAPLSPGQSFCPLAHFFSQARSASFANPRKRPTSAADASSPSLSFMQTNVSRETFRHPARREAARERSTRREQGAPTGELRAGKAFGGARNRARAKRSVGQGARQERSARPRCRVAHRRRQ